MRTVTNRRAVYEKEVNLQRFVDATPDGDYPDSRTAARVLIGRVTRRRYYALRRIARSLIIRHPYGEGYRCGHEHDCCGCLLGQYGGLHIQHYMGGWKVTISFTQSFNY